MLRGMILRLRLRRLIRSWIDLRQVWESARRGTEVTEAGERRFLMLKAQIASRLSVVDQVSTGASAKENRQRVEAILGLLNTCSSLGAAPTGELISASDFDQSWHQHFLFLNRLSGLGPGARPPHDGRGVRAMAPVPQETSPRRYRRKWSPLLWLRMTVGVVVVAAIIFLLVGAIGLGLVKAGKIENAGAVASAWGDLAGRLWQGFPEVATNLLAPIVGLYGTEVTIALLGLLLLCVGYWVFVRTA